MKDNQFVVVGYSLLDSEKYRKIMTSRKGMELTYYWLRRNVVRAPMRNVYAREVYERYFLKGYLAASIGEEQLARDLFISRHCVRDNLKDLEKHGIIKIKELKTKTRGEGAQKKQKVYIVGKWVSETDLQGREKYAQFYYIVDAMEKPFS
jgi:hypothetical protein